MDDINVLRYGRCANYKFAFETGQDGLIPGCHYNVVHLQQGVPDHVSEA